MLGHDQKSLPGIKNTEKENKRHLRPSDAIMPLVQPREKKII